MELSATDMLLILKGVGITISLCLCAMFTGSVIGIVIGLFRTSNFAFLRWIAWLYVYIIRGTPLLMQLFLVYYGLPLVIGYSIPAFTTAVLGLTLYAGAYLAEIVKSGILAIDSGQGEAARALGMNKFQELRYIIFPQALKIIIPPAAGFFIGLIKDSSLVSAIGFTELARAGRLIIARTFKPFEMYLLIGIIYFIMCFFLSKCSSKLEKRLSNG